MKFPAKGYKLETINKSNRIFELVLIRSLQKFQFGDGVNANCELIQFIANILIPSPSPDQNVRVDEKI